MIAGWESSMDDLLKPLRFINEPIEVLFDRQPLLEKTPEPPTGFIWRGETYRIVALLAEWQDYRRRGRMARNMRPTHAAPAERRGSWGVGVFYFRVLSGDQRIFDLYYDRAPQDSDRRKGGWFLFQELSAVPPV
jgi:hypothetical protein